MNRRKSDEVANGYPGFPYHQVTTEDLTAYHSTIYLRPLPCGGCFEGYLKPVDGPVVAPRLNQRRTPFGRWIERRFNR